MNIDHRSEQSRPTQLKIGYNDLVNIHEFNTRSIAVPIWFGALIAKYCDYSNKLYWIKKTHEAFVGIALFEAQTIVDYYIGKSDTII